MNDPVIATAIKHRDRLVDCAREFRFKAQRAKTRIGQELAELDAKTCEDSAAMLQKLGTEVTRLRLCIQNFDHGRMDRFELRRVVENWNADAAPPAPRERSEHGTEEQDDGK